MIVFVKHIQEEAKSISMPILTHDELPDSFDAQVQLSAGWGIFDFDPIKQARKMGYPFADYAGGYAMEENSVLSKVEVIHIQIETRKGPKIVSGISSVDETSQDQV